MNDLANATTGQISAIEGLAMQARALRLSIDLGYWQLARVLIEAKELVPHGEWGQWLQDNADVSQKTADDLMEAYRRFKGRPELETLGRTKTIRLLPLPLGTEERFLEEHDVEHMSTREIQEAVKQARAEAQAEIDRAEKARAAAEEKLATLEGAEPVIPQKFKDELEQERANRDYFTRMAQDAKSEKSRLEKENKALRDELWVKDGLLKEQQDALDKANNEKLDMKSAQARGEDKPACEELTPEVLNRAVRDFMDVAGKMPYMQTTFAGMAQREKERYAELLRMMSGWLDGAQKALNSTVMEGGIIVV